MAKVMERTTDLWTHPANEKWRVAITVRRGDHNRGHVSSQTGFLRDLYSLSEGRIHPNNTQVLVFSETPWDDPEFDELRAMPEVELHLGPKETSRHGTWRRWLRDVDHMATAHAFKGTYSAFSMTIVMNHLHPDSLALAKIAKKDIIRTWCNKHVVPFDGVDFANRELVQLPPFEAVADDTASSRTRK